MTIRLTDDQWADVQHAAEVPVRVSVPSKPDAFVLVRAEIYERFNRFSRKIR